MDKVVARRLRPHEGRKLRRLERQHANAVNSRHARIILLARERLCNWEIAQRVGCTPAWVRRIIHRFNAGGIDGITWYPYYCHPLGSRKFLAKVTEQIGEIALSPPRELIGMSVWSLPKLRDYLIEQGIVDSISLEWLRQILRRQKIRWRHTKTWKESNDPEFWPKYRRIRRLYDRPPPEGTRVCLDELGPLNLQPRHGRHYTRSGHVDRLRATYRRLLGVRYFFGVFDLDRNTLGGRFYLKKNARMVLLFLRWVRSRYSDGRTLHVVLDNVSYHLTPDVVAFTQANRIRFYLTPKYASWLNRIESPFTALRKFSLDNTDYQSHEEQQTAIRRYLAWRNGRRSITLQDWRAARRRHRRAA